MARKDYIEKKEKINAYEEVSDSNAEVAFWIYYQLGEKRSLNKVSKKVGIPIGKVNEWSKKFNWSQRVKDNDEMMNDAKAQKKIASLSRIAHMKSFALFMSVLNDPKAKAADKMKAAEKLQELSERSDKIKDVKKIAIRFPGGDNFKEKLKQAGVKVIE